MKNAILYANQKTKAKSAMSFKSYLSQTLEKGWGEEGFFDTAISEKKIKSDERVKSY